MLDFPNEPDAEKLSHLAFLPVLLFARYEEKKIAVARCSQVQGHKRS